MKIGPGFFGSLFTGSRGWELGFDGQWLAYAKARQAPIRITLDAVTGAVAKPGAIWAEIKISAPEQTIVCDGIVNDECEQFVKSLRSAVGQALLASLDRVTPEVIQLLARPQFLANRDVEIWKSTIANTEQTSLTPLLALVANPLLPREGASTESRKRIDLLIDVFSGPRAQVKARNQRFVADEIVRHKAFFDSVEKTPLTSEQRIACVVMEDRNLLVAAAGSGKTSTVVGKIGYALLTKKYAPSDFLVLAFNTSAAKELKERINDQLSVLLTEGERIKTRTFHALGMDIIAFARGKKPSIANFAGG